VEILGRRGSSSAVARQGKVRVPAGSVIFHLLDENGARNFGHSAVIIPNRNNYTYCSFGPETPTKQTLTINNFATWKDALAWAKGHGYTHGQYWMISAANATLARNQVATWSGKKYILSTSNCWQMVADALGSGNVTFSNHPNASPIFNYNRNTKVAKASGRLP
jgi:hypothetical protein